jgi:predicted metalloprotease with PDZ domain
LVSKFLKLSLYLGVALPLLPQTSPPIRLALDISDAPRKIFHARLTIPVKPGPLTLVYPKWIPGEHSPSGPIDNFAGLTISANGQTIPWQRDSVNMFSFHLTVPPGVTSIEAKVDFLATAGPTGFSAGASTNANLAVVSWNNVALYPAGIPSGELRFAPSIKLPSGWKFATALTADSSLSSSSAGDISFSPVPLDMLVDSPVLAGRFFKEIPLAPEISPKHYLDLAADGPEDLDISSDEIEQFSNLVRETGALYRSRHYASYHFLLTLSDSVAHFGLEHHQSSDDRVEARNFLDEDLSLLNGSLLPHEFTHSWNGKYRRPAGLATPDFQQPMKGDLLWVYEGLTEYFGDVLAARSGIWTPDQYRAMLASSAAELDHRPGRTWRDLQDTATAAQILYSANDQWDNWRRSVDYYPEGELIWLEADTTIRQLSNDKRSLNDFCARFLGAGGNTRPMVSPYTFEDLMANLNAVQPNDWTSFFNQRLTSKAPRAPLGGITQGGYRIEYSDQPNEFIRAAESRDHAVNAWYSLGIHVSDLTIHDVLLDSPAYAAGLGPDMKLIAINGRKATDELLRAAIHDSKTSQAPIELIVENTGFFKLIKLDYHEGEKYPHLVRDNAKPALLDDILKPLVPRTAKKTAD